MAQRKQSSFAKSGFRNSVFEAPVIMEGWLKKHSTGMIKRWQKRYFTIAGHYMKYYEDEAKDEKTLKGTIDIAGLQSASQTQMEGEIQLIIKGETIVLHACDGPDAGTDAQRWVNILQPMVGIGVDENPLFKMRARPEQKAAVEREKAEREAKSKAAQEGLEAKRKASTAAPVLGMARSVKRPLRVTAASAEGLRAVRDASNPMVVVSVVDRTHGFEVECQHMGSPQMGTCAPSFGDESVLLPGVTANVEVVFTVVDFGDEGDLEFLGQATVPMSAELWSHGKELKLELGAMSDVHLRDGDGKELRIEHDNAPATWDGTKAYVNVKLEPFPAAYSLCGELDKTGGDRYASVWKQRWCCLVEHSLYYFDHMGATTPKAVINLKEAEDISHPDAIIEHISVKMPGKLWQFRTATVVEGGQWWWKMRQAAGMSTDSQSGAGGGQGISIQQSEFSGMVPIRKMSSY